MPPRLSADTRRVPDPDVEPGKKRRWLVLLIDTAAVLSVVYGIGYFCWFMAHQSEYSSSISARFPIDFKLWFFNLPFFLLGLIWLIVRSAKAYGVQYFRLEAKYPILRQATIWAIAFGAAAIVGLTIAVFSFM